MRSKAKIGVIGAMDSEIGYLIAELKNESVTEICGCSFHAGVLYGRCVTILKCGIGKVNAARGTQLLLERFMPDALLNTGIAGALDPSLRVGDTVIATGFVQHDFDVTAFGHAPGYLCTGEHHDRPTVFTPERDLLSAIKQAAEGLLVKRTLKQGLIATGDIFVADPETRRHIRKRFNAIAVDMEGAAIAQTAAYARIPFAALRVISDRADADAGKSIDRSEEEMARRSASVILELLKRS